MVQSYRDLVAWNKAMELVTEIYRVTHTFPRKNFSALGRTRVCALKPGRTHRSAPMAVVEELRE